MDLEAELTATNDSRRSFIRKAGLAGGVAWVAPQVLNTTAAHAQISDPDCIPITSFDVYQRVEDSTTAGVATGTVADPSILGGIRKVTLKATKEHGPGGNAQVVINEFIPNLSLAAALGVSAVATVQYGLAVGGTGDIDLSSANRFIVTLAIETQVDPDLVDVTITVNGVSVTKMFPVGFNGSETYLFSEYAGVDFSDVDNLSFVINTTGLPSLDLSIDSIIACP